MLPGRLTRWKGGLDFIEAIARLGRPDVCCVLVGAAPRRGFRREIEAAIQRHGLEGQFRLVDDCREMPAAYKLTDVVISASTDPEGFGRVVAEAQAMGRPVIATDHGGARETIVPGLTGWLVPPQDPAALAAAIAEALALGPGERAALARRAMRHVAANFTRDVDVRAHDRDLRGAAVPGGRGGGAPAARRLGLRGDQQLRAAMADLVRGPSAHGLDLLDNIQ